VKISASDQVTGWLRNLPPESKRRVRTALKGMVKWKGDIKPLRGELEGFYRLRVGGYRIVYRLAATGAVQLEYADTRDVVYETFRQLRILGEVNE
jgi:mRNA-degrading endonuclease RelE of RelBE toxin-antitoxin system